MAVLKVFLTFKSNFYEFLALICWGLRPPTEDYPYDQPSNICNTFDGTAVAESWESNHYHVYSSLAYFNGKPTTVGSSYLYGEKKVETLGEDGWFNLDDFPV